MKFLQELHNLYEGEVPGQGPIELKDLVKYFPNNHDRAIQKLWGSDRLVFNGQPFFNGSNNVIDAAEAAVNDWANDGGQFRVSIYTSSPSVLADDGDMLDINLEYEEPLAGNKLTMGIEGQEVYMGYDSASDTLYVGYDITLNEDELNSEWDKEFLQVTGVDFDYEDETHRNAFSLAHKQWLKLRPWILFKLSNESGSLQAEKVSEGDGGFYPEGFNEVKRDFRLIDLHLD